MKKEEKTPSVHCDNCGDLLDPASKEPLNMIVDMEPVFRVQFFCSACASAGVGTQ